MYNVVVVLNLTITPEKENSMNIRVKAGIDVALFIVGAIIIGGTVRLVLDYLSEIYGAEQVFEGIVFAGISVLLICFIKMMYNVRVASLESIDRLNKILKK